MEHFLNDWHAYRSEAPCDFTCHSNPPLLSASTNPFPLNTYCFIMTVYHVLLLRLISTVLLHSLYEMENDPLHSEELLFDRGHQWINTQTQGWERWEQRTASQCCRLLRVSAELFCVCLRVCWPLYQCLNVASACCCCCCCWRLHGCQRFKLFQLRGRLNRRRGVQHEGNQSAHNSGTKH